MYDLWKITPFFNKIDSKRSSSRSFHGHFLHPRITGFVHAFSFIFFPFDDFFVYDFSNLKGII